MNRCKKDKKKVQNSKENNYIKHAKMYHFAEKIIVFLMIITIPKKSVGITTNMDLSLNRLNKEEKTA